MPGSDRLAFSTEGRTGPIKTFKPELYDCGYAINLIIMFRRTIQVNLEKEEPHFSCFLPKFCTKARNAPGMQVALFGRIDIRDSAAGELKGMRWGVFDISKKEEQVFEVNDDLAKEFVFNAPRTNAPHLVSKSRPDKNGQQIMVPTKNHYAMTTYAKRFDVVLERESTDEIRNVRLVRTSFFDRKVLLDEDSWAVTLVSVKDATPDSLTSGNDSSSLGHAMIAYEGVKRDDAKMRQFLTYIHITTRQENRRLQTITGGQAKVEVCEDEDYPRLKWELLIGPTWPRTSTVVRRMIKSAMQDGNIDFAFLGSRESPVIAGSGGLSVIGVTSWASRYFIFAGQSIIAGCKALIPDTTVLWGHCTHMSSSPFAKLFWKHYYELLLSPSAPPLSKTSFIAYAILAWVFAAFGRPTSSKLPKSPSQPNRLTSSSELLKLRTSSKLPKSPYQSNWLTSSSELLESSSQPWPSFSQPRLSFEEFCKSAGLNKGLTRKDQSPLPTGELFPYVPEAKEVFKTIPLDKCIMYSAIGLGLVCITYWAVEKRSKRQNCADWTINKVSLAGISIQGVPNTVVTPNMMIKYLNSNSSCIKIDSQRCS